MSALVSFRNVSVTLGGRPILHNFSLDVDAGDTLVLLGRSGSGKTTALKTVNGLIVPTSGEVLVEGTPTTAWDPIRLRRRIGYAIQEGGLFPHFTVADNIALVPRLEHRPPEEVHARVTELLNAVGLPAEVFGMRYPKQLSGGQRQRVGVARALAADPPLLLFDEPFGGLDPVTRLDLQQQFVSLRRRLGKTAMFVTHDVREALLLATRIAVMVAGALEFIGSPQEFLQARTAEAKAFLACLQPLEVSCR
ncbi:MAG TPA: ATP-binding cassette domain-containing protein [Nitrospiraceae bacterium]|nr:ATP-binding cassette domain-containing protein [Nitrospiraceae bacterium]